MDVVIACTANTVLGPDYFVGSSRRLVIDLGLPRNIEPIVAEVAGVELLDLETVRLHAPLDALSAHDDATAIVRGAAAEFTAEREIEPTIVALRTHVFDLLEAEIARARARGAGDETEAALRHLAGVLLHGPSARGREWALEGRAAEFTAGLNAVYGITPKPADQNERTETA